MNADQCRAARALLDLTRTDLSRLAEVGLNVIGKFETGQTVPRPKTISKLRCAFRTMGIRFINDDDGVGVRRGSTIEEIVESDMHVDHVRPMRIVRINPVTGPIAPEQSRAARAFLGYSQTVAAREAGVGLSLLVAFENGVRMPKDANVDRIRLMYERKGVVFTEIDDRPAVQFVGTQRGSHSGRDRSERGAPSMSFDGMLR